MFPPETLFTAHEEPPSILEQFTPRHQAPSFAVHYESGVGHIGGNLSCLDLLLTLHGTVKK